MLRHVFHVDLSIECNEPVYPSIHRNESQKYAKLVIALQTPAKMFKLSNYLNKHFMNLGESGT